MAAHLQPSLREKLSLFLKQSAVDARAVHGLSVKTGCLRSVYLCNNLVYAYGLQCMIADARKLFDEIPLRNPTTWSTMVAGYVQAGSLRDAVILFRKMRSCKGGGHEEGQSFLPDKVAHASILKGCSRMDDLRTGVQIHCSVIKLGVAFDNFMVGTLVDMYGKCGELEGSWKVFEQTAGKDVVAWTAMITGFTSHGQQQFKNVALLLFKEMIEIGVWPVDITFVSLVKIFDEPCQIKQAKQVHGCMVKLGIKPDVFLASALITMYSNCGGIDEAVRLFARVNKKDMVYWTSLLSGFMHNGFYMEAINVFRGMIEQKALIDIFVITSLLCAFTMCKQLRLGKEIHAYALRNSSGLDASINNALIALYGKCGEIRKAEIMFQAMEKRDCICWTTMLTCYGQNDYGEKAVFLFYQMIKEGQRPQVFSFTGAIRACASLASISMGEQIHSQSIKVGILNDLSVGNSLITMYGRCGNIDAALDVFNCMTVRDTITWNAIIACFAHHGFGSETTVLFYRMQRVGMQPDDFTFLGVLVSCSHAGLVAEGHQYFKSMSTLYGLKPKMEHYACMVDLFGRAGKFDDAMDFIQTMPCIPGHLVWESLLGSCLVHGNVELGKIAAERILKTKPQDPSAYVILSNLHALVGMWDQKANVLNRMKDLGVQKEPSGSWVEVKGLIHVFSADDKSHPQSPFIYWKLEMLKNKMKEAGYVANTVHVLHDIKQEDKETSVLHHSEKLALAFALIATPKGTPIRIMQNLRCCKDCHTAMRLVSKIEDRYITLRDTKRFHHFLDGICSCGDYW